MTAQGKISGPGIFLLLLLCCCEMSPDDVPVPVPSPVDSLYFPPVEGNTWETKSLDELEWQASDLSELLDFLESQGTRAFIILHGGKVVVEEYWGREIDGSGDFDQDSYWYWASAGKTLTSTLIGIAQNEGHLLLSDPTSVHLGSGWSSMSSDLENDISIFHQLTMTTGLDYTVNDNHCTDPDCLRYLNEAGSEWYYHNAPYTLLTEVISSAAGASLDAYTEEKIGRHTGIKGRWIRSGYNKVYWSTARDMARFGLLISSNGMWGEERVISDTNYIRDMITPSQDHNPSYGYLWWLNGQSSYKLPGVNTDFPGQLSPHAPPDAVAGLGKNGQIVQIIPSLDLVLVRMGEAPDDSTVPTDFHDELWERLHPLLGR